MEITWQEIAERINRGRYSEKLVKSTIMSFYTAFVASIDSDADVTIKHIGRAKITAQGIIIANAKKKHDRKQKRLKWRIKKRRERQWAFELIDKYWTD